MDTDPATPPTPAERLRAWVRPARGEVLGLAVFLAGALLVTGVVVAQGLGRPSPPPDLPSAAAHTHGGPAEVGASVGVDGASDGPAAGTDPAPTEGDGPPDPDDGSAAPAELVVHVSGAVVRPGIVVLEPGGRVADAIAAAGGLDEGALPERVNLARAVVDGEQVHVPREGDEDLPPIAAGPPAVEGGGAAGGPVERAGTGGGAGGGQLDLNRASVAELETLPGIGPAKATAIVRHRDEHGPFTAPGDLRDVTGIGEATFQGLAELVTVG